MKERFRTIALTVSFAVIIVCLFGLYYSARQQPVRPVREFSFVLNCYSPQNRAALRAGAQRAAEEYKIDLNIISLSRENDAEEQAELIRREGSGEAAGVIVCAADSAITAQAVQALPDDQIVVSVDSVLDGADYAVLPDYDLLGRQMASILAVGGFGGRPVVLASSLPVGTNAEEETAAPEAEGEDPAPAGRADLAALRDAMTEALENAGCTVIPLALDQLLESDAFVLTRRLRQMGASAVVALDMPALELLSAQLPRAEFSLYGFGSNNAILQAMEAGKIASLMVSDDFSLGYLAVSAAGALAEGKEPRGDVTIRSARVTQNNMYDRQNQWLLFANTD